MLLEVAISLFLVWFMWYIVTTYQLRRSMPPGPRPLPFFGNRHQLDHDPLVSFENLKKQYGDIFTVWDYTGPTVVLNSIEVLQEALLTRKDDMVARLPNSVYPIDLVFGRDVVCANYGKEYLFRRKVFKSSTHVFGVGRDHAEDRMGHAIESLVQKFKDFDEQPFFPKRYFAAAIISELWGWLTEKKYPVDHPLVNSLVTFNEMWPTLYSSGNLFYAFPLLWCLPTSFREKFENVIKTRENTLTPELLEHCETYNPGVVRDLTDSFLAAYEKKRGKGAVKNKESFEEVKGLMVNVLIGATDTAASFISWFILYMLVHQDIQKRIHEELDNILGRDRLPCWEDAKKLHFLQAAICEVMRHTSFVPFVPHSALRNTVVKGYKIPKDATVWFNLISVHYDLNHWTEPEAFRPDRFLDSDGKFVGWTKLPAFVPLNIGRRQCAGMVLGKIQAFLLASCLLFHFDFQLPPGEAIPSLHYKEFGTIVHPVDYKAVAKKRI